jgi:hypothetical protein
MKKLALVPVVALLAAAAPAPAQSPPFCPPTAGCPAPSVGAAQPTAVIEIPPPKKAKKGKKGKKRGAASAIVYISPW